MRALNVTACCLLGIVAAGCGDAGIPPAAGPPALAEAAAPLDASGHLDGAPGSTGDASADATTDGAAPDAGPAPTCDVRAYGAKGDGVTKDTAAIQAAIDACAGTGGTVLVTQGKYLTGMIRLESLETLYLDATGTLFGSQDDADYPSTNPPTDNTQLKNCRKALVYAESAHDVHIAGRGTIDGNGNTPKWIGPSTLHPEATRPMAVYTALSTNVTIEDITIKDAAMWCLVNLEANNLTIRNVTIHSLLSGNRDGIDIVDCHHVLVENCTIASEDDSICIKSGTRRGVDDVTIRHNHVLQSIVANGLKFGTASYGSFSNVTFDTNTVDSADKAGMAVESVDGADISNIHFRNITLHQVGSPVFILLGDRGTTPADDVHKVGSIDGVTFENVTADATHTWGSAISGTTTGGTTYRLKNLSFTNVQVTGKGGLATVPADPPEYAGQYPDPNLWGDLPAFGYFIRHADGVTFTGSSATPSPADARKATVTRDVTGFSVQ
jgi:polygalacturonase